MTILFILMGILLWGFIGTIVALYGVLPSLSDSYYELPEKWRDYIFTPLFFALGLFSAILGESGWMVFAGFGICLVGAAPQFKDSFVKPVHFVGAGIAAIFSQLYILFALGLWPLNIAFIVACILISVFRANNRIWWLEMACFVSAYGALGLKIFWLLLVNVE
jgi:hypothetical protein